MFYNIYEPKIKQLLLKYCTNFAERKYLLEEERKELSKIAIDLINEFGFFITYSADIKEIEQILSNTTITQIPSKDIVFWQFLYDDMFKKYNQLSRTMNYKEITKTIFLNGTELFKTQKEKCELNTKNYKLIIDDLKKHI